MQLDRRKQIVNELAEFADRHPSEILQIAFDALSRNHLLSPKWFASLEEGVIRTGIGIVNLNPGKELAEAVIEQLYGEN